MIFDVIFSCKLVPYSPSPSSISSAVYYSFYRSSPVSVLFPAVVVLVVRVSVGLVVRLVLVLSVGVLVVGGCVDV